MIFRSHRSPLCMWLGRNNSSYFHNAYAHEGSQKNVIDVKEKIHERNSSNNTLNS